MNCQKIADSLGNSGLATAYHQNGQEVSLSSQSYSTTISDENAIEVANSGTLTLRDSTITKNGDTKSEERRNAAVLATSSSQIKLTDCAITTDGDGANAAFAYGLGSVVTLSNVTITTTADSSRGVDAASGGIININNSAITTIGTHCAALASHCYDNAAAPRIIATNCTGCTKGDGSPGIYCTGKFIVKAENGGASRFTATGSEAAVVEGLNSIILKDTDITGSKKWGVMIYQSMSGDAEVGQGTFTMTGGTLTNNSSGPAFFVCNTTGVINLSAVRIISSSGTLLKAMAPTGSDNTNTGWGNLGGTVTFNANGQDYSKNLRLEGDIVLDYKSSITMRLSNHSTLAGAIDNTNTANSVIITIDSTSKWIATESSYIDTLILSNPAGIDADAGVNIYAGTLSGVSIPSGTQLASGGYIYF